VQVDAAPTGIHDRQARPQGMVFDVPFMSTSAATDCLALHQEIMRSKRSKMASAPQARPPARLRPSGHGYSHGQLGTGEAT